MGCIIIRKLRKFGVFERYFGTAVNLESRSGGSGLTGDEGGFAQPR